METWEGIIISSIFFAYLGFLYWYVNNVPKKFLKFQLKTFLVVIFVGIIDTGCGCFLMQLCILYWFYKLHKHDDWDD